jgi:hypothetical protein
LANSSSLRSNASIPFSFNDAKISPTSFALASGDGPDAEDGDDRRRNEQIMNALEGVEYRYVNSVTARPSSKEWNLIKLSHELDP